MEPTLAGSLWPEALAGAPVPTGTAALPAAPGAPTAAVAPIAAGVPLAAGAPIAAGVPLAAGASLAGGPLAAVAGSSRAPDEAIGCRVRAGLTDNFIQGVLIVAIVIALSTQGVVLSFWTAVALGLVGSWLYHFFFESQGGQTPGKKRFGIKVVRLDGGPAEPWRIALRNLLRGVDEFGPLSASGLITMWLSGAARRQRIGDKAAGTTVVPVSGSARRLPSPRWLLPALASLSILVGIGEVHRVVQASSASQSGFETSFVASCTATAPRNESCSCVYQYLHDRAGYHTPDQWEVLLRQVDAAVAAHDPSQLPPPYVAAALACRTS